MTAISAMLLNTDLYCICQFWLFKMIKSITFFVMQIRVIFALPSLVLPPLVPWAAAPVAYPSIHHCLHIVELHWKVRWAKFNVINEGQKVLLRRNLCICRQCPPQDARIRRSTRSMAWSEMKALTWNSHFKSNQIRSNLIQVNEKQHVRSMKEPHMSVLSNWCMGLAERTGQRSAWYRPTRRQWFFLCFSVFQKLQNTKKIIDAAEF